MNATALSPSAFRPTTTISSNTVSESKTVRKVAARSYGSTWLGRLSAFVGAVPGFPGIVETTSTFESYLLALREEAASAKKAVDIDSLVAEEEKDPIKAKLLAEARGWVTDTLCKGEHSLKTLRLSKGMSQSQLAQALGTSQAHIARLEAGDPDPRLSTLRRLADVLEIPIDEIVAAVSNGCDRSG